MRAFARLARIRAWVFLSNATSHSPPGDVRTAPVIKVMTPW